MSAATFPLGHGGRDKQTGLEHQKPPRQGGVKHANGNGDRDDHRPAQWRTQAEWELAADAVELVFSW